MASNTTSKLESLAKEDLVKYIKKQSSQLKQFKSKCEDLQTQLREKENDIQSFEGEKAAWLSRGIQAEFEKKEEVSAKNEELQMAAELGKQMLERNDQLQGELERLQENHSNLVEELNRVKCERDELKLLSHPSNRQEQCESIGAEESVRLLDKIKELQVEREETLEKLENLTLERNKLKQTCKDLKKRMNVLESDVERINKGMKYPTENKIRDLTNEKMELMSKIEMLEEDRTVIIKEFENLQELMAKLEQENKEKEQADAKVNKLMEELDVSRKEAGELKERLDNYGTDQEDIQSSYRNIQREHLETKNINEELKKQMEELWYGKNDLANSLSVVTEERNEMRENISGLEMKYAELTEQLAEMNQRNKELSVQLQSVNREYSQIKNISESFREKLEAEEKYKKNITEEIEKLKVEKEKFTKACRSLKTSFEESKKALDQTTSDYESQKQLIESLQLEKKKMTQLIKKLKVARAGQSEKQKSTDKSELEALISERDDVVLSLKETQTENEKLQEFYKCLEKKHENLVFEKDELQEELSEVTNIKNNLENEKSQLEIAMKDINDALRDERKKMEDILDNMKEELKSNMQTNELLKKQVNEITSVKDELEERFTKMNEEHGVALHKNEELVKQLQFTTGEKNKIQHALGAVKRQWEEHQTTCGGSHKELEEKIQNLVSEKIEIEKSLDDRLAELSNLHDEKQEIVEKISVIEKEKDHITKKLQEQIVSLENEYEEYKNDMENSTQTLGAELAKVTEEKNNLDAEIEELFHAHDELQVKYDEEINANKQLNDLVLKTSEEKEVLFKENQVLSERLAEIQSNELSSESQYYTEISSLQESNENLLREMDILRSQLEVKGKISKNEECPVSSENVDARIASDDIKNGECSQKEEINILHNRISDLTEEKNQIENDFKNSEIEYQNQLAILSQQLDEEKYKTREVEQKLDEFDNQRLDSENRNVLKFNEEIKVLKGECEKLKQDYEKRENQTEELRSEVELWKEKCFIKEREKEEQDREWLTLAKSFENSELMEEETTDNKNLLNKFKLLVIKTQGEISSLKRDLTERDDEISGLKTSSSSLIEQLQKKDMELCAKGELCGTNEKDLLNSKTVLDSLSAKLTEKTEECEQLANNLEKSEIIIKDLKESYKELENVSESGHKRLVSVEETLSNEQQQLRMFQDALKKTQLESEEKDLEMNKLQDTILNLQKSLEELRNENQIQEEIDEQTKILDIKREEMMKYAMEKEIECNNLKEQFQNQSIEIETLNQSLHAKEKEFNVNLSSSNNKVEDLLKELKNEKNRCSELNDVIKVKKETEDKLNESLVSLKHDITDKEQTIGELNEIKGSLELELKTLREHRTSFREEVIKKEEAIQSFASKQNALVEKVKSSNDLMKEQEKSLQYLQAKVDSYSQEKNELEAEINRLREYESKEKTYLEKTEMCSKDIEEIQVRSTQLEKQNKDLQSKMNKMKQMIVKTKKETENVKIKFEKEKASLMEVIRQKDETSSNEDEVKAKRASEQNIKINEFEQEIKTMTESVESLKEQLEISVREKESCQEMLIIAKKENAKLNEKYNEGIKESDGYVAKMASMDQEIDLLEKQNNDKVRELKELSEKLGKMEEELAKERSDAEKIKSEFESAKEQLESSEKEANKASLVDLELKDCQKALEKIEIELSESETKLKQKIDETEALEKQLREKDIELDSLGGKFTQAEEKEKKLKTFANTLKKKLDQAKEQENEYKKAQQDVQKELEAKTHENESIKVQLSMIHAEKQTLEQQLHSVIENNKMNLENLDAKLKRVKAESEKIKQAKDSLEKEYENYKTRVHSVLKQQKAKPSTPAANMETDERSQFQQNVLQLKIKVQETSEKLRSLQSDYEDLEIENERLTTVHSKLSVDSEKKEKFWKERIEKISQEYSTNVEQLKETIEHLTVKNETLAKTYKDKIRKIEEEHKSKLEKLGQEINELEKERQREPSKDKSRLRESPPLKLNLAGDNAAHLRSEERQAGEGMENTELEQSNVPSQPVTPMSGASLHSVSLETLLSPTKGEGVDVLSEFTQEEVVKARREIDHLSELLRESEATSMRLGEQAKVLKDEIRRLERNQEREQGLSNLEYLKNIIMKFLSQGSNEKEQLIPVLTAMLKLSEDEKNFLSKFARETDESADDANSSWSSYLYRWSSVN